MALRDVTIRATLNEMIGDENVEIWLKVGAAAWALYNTEVVGAGPTQDFALDDLEEDVEHKVQLRGIREARYRDDYSSANPDIWPVQSLFTFTPGTEEYAAPTINTLAWSRTSGVSQRITVNVTSSVGNEALALQLLRDGVVVDEVAGPHGGAVDLVDLDPPIAEEHTYTTRHRSGFLVGLQSAPQDQFAGPAAPTGLTDVTLTTWYSYDVEWDAPVSGAETRVQDNYLCGGVFADRDAVTAPDALGFSTAGLEKDSALSPNGNIPCSFNVRARHEVESFSVTDVSDWCAPVAVNTEIAPDETAFNSCP